MVVSLLTHVCVTRPQWVKNLFPYIYRIIIGFLYSHIYSCVSLTESNTLHNSYFKTIQCQATFSKDDFCSWSCINCIIPFVIQYPTRNIIIPCYFDIICNIDVSISILVEISQLWFRDTCFILKHWDREKMASISLTTYSNAFSWMKIY